MSMLKHPARRCPVVAGVVFALCGGVTPADAAPRHDRKRAKVSEEVRKRGRARGTARMDVIVQFRRDPGASERSLVAAFGGEVRRRHRSRWMSVRLPGRAAESLANDPAVEFVALDAPVSAAALDVARVTAGLPPPASPESWFKGAGVTIAEIDSGVERRPEISGLVASVDLVGTYDPTFAPTGSVDPNGHGTHVAGILVGDGSHSQDGKLTGIAPQASLVSIRVLDGLGRGTTSSMLAGLQWVLDNKDAYGIRVLNLSLGHPIYEPAAVDPLVQAVEQLWDAGVVVVCSAGNAGRNGHGTISSPCNSRKVITVGALNDRRSLDLTDDTVTTFSSRGPTRFDLVAKPDLLAPGNKIVSVRSEGSTLDLQFPGNRVAGHPSRPWEKEYFELSGTSMAAPMVSGAVALLLERDPALNPATVKARLMRSARKAAVADPFAAGAGALDILAALRDTSWVVGDAPSPRVFVAETPDPTTGQSPAGQLTFENTAVLWSNPSLSLPTLWGNAVLWSEAIEQEPALLSSYAVHLPTVSATALLWPPAALSPSATLWPESTLWSEAVLWPDEDFPLTIEALGTPVPDP
jgi:serine protease AprX